MSTRRRTKLLAYAKEVNGPGRQIQVACANVVWCCPVLGSDALCSSLLCCAPLCGTALFFAVTWGAALYMVSMNVPLIGILSPLHTVFFMLPEAPASNLSVQ